MTKDQTRWYKDGIFYEVRVGAFYDGNADGIGDFKGLTQKLDYLQDLGITTIWLLPFYPSPLKDDGYDIADYSKVHPSLGTVQDFEVFLDEAHKRGLRVITELVLNHTSDQHPWFQRARRAPPNSPERNFYVWSETTEKYNDARIIFKDFERSNWHWDPLAKAYYWHRFFSHQPDLNFDSPDVQKAVLDAMEFWLKMGVDGMRLDAIPYLYERQGTNCENLPETHAFLKKMREHIDSKFADRMFLAEANQWPDDAVQYFGQGDECHMAFHFPIMPRLFMGLHMEDRYPIIDILEQTPSIPENCQWAVFLRNHDELTLEMVTDEERDYMYRVYAIDPQARVNLGIRRRLAPLLGNNRRKFELMNGLLFSLPGTPIIYYGDEIGMGDNIYLGDRNGVRTPMQWSGDRNAGFSSVNPQKMYLSVIVDPEYHYETVNMEAQQNNPHSLLWWTKRLIGLRKRYKAFGRGTIEFLHPANPKVLTFIRRYEDENILVVANLSRYVQYVELDLSKFKGFHPVELFGRGQFPAIGDLPYFLTLGPHGFYWFSLEPVKKEAIPVSGQAAFIPTVEVGESWDAVFQKRFRGAVEEALPPFLLGRRWFGGKSNHIKSVRIMETVPLAFKDTKAIMNFVQVEYTDAQPELYFVPMTYCTGARMADILQNFPTAALIQVKGKKKDEKWEGIIYDAMMEADFCSRLFEIVANQNDLRGLNGSVNGIAINSFRKGHTFKNEELVPTFLKSEQSNSSVIFGEQYILKVIRRLDMGVNPDLEVCLFLTEKTSFKNAPPVVGYLEYNAPSSKEPMTVGLLQNYVRNEGDAWQYTLGELSLFFEQTATKKDIVDSLPLLSDPFSILEKELPSLVKEMIGGYLESVRLLGQRTAELHLALSSQMDDPYFAPEFFTTFTQRSYYESLRVVLQKGFSGLRKAVFLLKGNERSQAQSILANENAVFTYFEVLKKSKFDLARIRCHGDFHLGQVLYTGKDFVIIDFEGEPARSLTERKLKRPCMKDVAGMIRSFHYAANWALREHGRRGVIPPEQFQAQEKWANFWYQWISTIFLDSYLTTAKNAPFLPKDKSQNQILLKVFLIEKGFYELAYELNHRPDWVDIPLKGLTEILEGLQ